MDLEEEELLDLEEKEEVEIIFKKKKGVQIQEEEEINIPIQGEAITTRHHKGMINQIFNVITARNLDILQMSVGKNKLI